jgi:hypothetical protein
MPSVNASRLDRWLGRENTEHVSGLMADWYGPPIALHGVPGAVYATKGGDFVGDLRAGWEATAFDRARDVLRRMERAVRVASNPRRARLHAGFASLSDLIAEATVGGKRQELLFNKVGTTGVVSVTNSLWRVGNHPPAGAASSAAPGGIAPTDATTGAIPFQNPGTGGDTTHVTTGFSLATVAANTLLLYDRIFGVAKTMNSTATEAVTGLPSRYQSTTGGAVDSAEGNFLFIEVGTALAATAHNWTVCQYTDQGGTTAVTLPSVTGNASAIINRLDMPAGSWFCPLAAGDTGIKALTQMQCSAAVATGAIDFVIGHPIAWMPCPVANMVCVMDGINSAFNLARIFDDAALALLEVCKPATTATTYNGAVTLVAG